MADAGYSGRKFLSLVRWQYSTHPVVNLNPTHPKLLTGYGVRNTPEGKTLSEPHHGSAATEGYAPLLSVPDCDAGVEDCLSGDTGGSANARYIFHAHIDTRCCQMH